MFAGCGDASGWAKPFQRAAFGGCVRRDALMYGLAQDCSADSLCPCGAFCHPIQRVCAFTCAAPPGDGAQRCPPRLRCDDSGRCAVP